MQILAFKANQESSPHPSHCTSQLKSSFCQPGFLMDPPGQLVYSQHFWAFTRGNHPSRMLSFHLKFHLLQNTFLFLYQHICRLISYRHSHYVILVLPSNSALCLYEVGAHK